ncbi:hypothetical protein MRX96_001072 [Rhipicephalus microplus]
MAAPEEPESSTEAKVENEEKSEENVTFKSLGVVDVLCEACEQLKWKAPTKIPARSLASRIARQVSAVIHSAQPVG